ncbi:MAG: hypothetical protein AB1414_02510 [bacterium]
MVTGNWLNSFVLSSAERYLITIYQSPVTRIKFRALFVQHDTSYFYKFQSISIILSPYRPYLLIPFLTLLIYSLNGYPFYLEN